MFSYCYLHFVTDNGVQHDIHIRLWSYRSLIKIIPQTQFPYRVWGMILIRLGPIANSDPTGATSRAGTTYIFENLFRDTRFVKSLIVLSLFCRSLFNFLSLFFWLLYCLSFYLRFMINLWYLQTFLPSRTFLSHLSMRYLICFLLNSRTFLSHLLSQGFTLR